MDIKYDTILTKMDKSKEYITNGGSPEKSIYQYKIVDGIKILVDTGQKTSIYDLIQSHAAETDINNIIARFKNGDTSALKAKPGMYGDFAHMPKTYAELFARIQECENVFNNLDPKIRNRYNNSAASFWSDFGSDNFVRVFNELNPETIEEVIKEEVKDA